MRERERGGKATVDERYTQWKSLVPVLYDYWFANHNLVWSSLSCSWGPQLEQATYKNRQRLYLSEQESAATLQTDGSVPNTLVIANCEVVKPRVAVVEHISQFNEEARSPFVKKYKTIIHPGESPDSSTPNSSGKQPMKAGNVKSSGSPTVGPRVFADSNLNVMTWYWSPDRASVFGSAAEDGFLNIWDHEKVGKKKESAGSNSPPLIWRMSDSIYRPEDEVLAELEKSKAHVLSCSPKS
ncbi:hypothetical protein C4D60_Mb07t03390 [Musa balbisiana]|uniref:Histone-binding protein RBBP4-like N-terminal domain-containing protein n=1 Tax=Musa balbisiana TaxID=52838 RepID=A0A4S8JCT2_MUSBA|nr:hypothetical protein C4D60_Mb07t03390 [Musa balbisiana]